jgi:hypothetical protein
VIYSEPQRLADICDDEFSRTHGLYCGALSEPGLSAASSLTFIVFEIPCSDFVDCGGVALLIWADSLL